jgi:hypothetical protein
MAFDLLAQSIETISTDYFSHPPEGSPLQLSVLMEPNLPELLGSTATATELRSIMVQHKIFKVLHRRIFQPYVFIALDGYSDAETDQLLNTLSRLICRKSIRREALWRSITMRAIYTSLKARETIGIKAASILDEVIEQVEDLATPSCRAPLVAALKEVVRSSIELWRQTRVEVDRITSTMPDVSTINGLSSVLLWVRPHIVREKVAQASMFDNDGVSDPTTVLLQGTALRQDSPLVLKRYEELAHRVSLG